MGLLDRWLNKKRKFWFVCYNCLMQTGHDALKSIFYSEGPPVYILGRPLTECPRCRGTNTRSFQQLKDEGSEAALWGFEQLVKKYPRSRFEVASLEVREGR